MDMIYTSSERDGRLVLPVSCLHTGERYAAARRYLPSKLMAEWEKKKKKRPKKEGELQTAATKTPSVPGSEDM